MEVEPRQPVPVFPLPDLVAFPGALALLHVFELRYRALVRDALSGERLVALAVLKPGWESEYHGSPEFHDLGCLAGFDEVRWLPDDCYDLRMRALARVRFESMAREFPYRAMRVSVLPQAPYGESDPLVQVERRALTEAWQRLFDRPLDQAPHLPPGEVSYETLVAATCMALPAPTAEKLEWLAMDSVIERGHRVREWMERARRSGGETPERGAEHN